MGKKMLIDATHAEETRVVVVDGNKVEDFDFESENKRQLAGNIYLAKVTRVEPSLQAAFVDYGGNRHGFLAFSEIHPDYYQIPVADRQALMAEEEEEARRENEDQNGRKRGRSRRSDEDRAVADTDTGEGSDEDAAPEADAIAEAQTAALTEGIPGMDVVDVARGDEGATAPGDDDAHDDDEGPRPYVAADDAAERDSTIEAVADDDTQEELRRPRKPRAKKYKIQEVIKVRQILLVQVVKEERGNKGAALTTYLSLAGRYCVLMPNTARGGGISRKITAAADRKKLKEIAEEIDVPRGAGLIIRTAGARRTRTEIKRDYEYLLRLWEQIRELTLKSIAPAPIYEEGNLIKRSIRDLYNREIEEVLVEGEHGYRTAKDFMKMIMPSHAKNVKHYHEAMPLFARHQVESYLAGMFNPTVQLKSGGYIVIGITEALVAIDVNSGKATKEGSIEETAYKTNMEAAEEVARQLRLRDLAGLIVIDFIDMEDRKHNANVEKHFKEKLKNDRARIQVGRISAFGLLEMSRQRLRPGMLEASTQPCPHCHGTGLLRSDDSVALAILRQLEEEGTRKKTREVLVTMPVAICNYLMNHKRDHVLQIEARYGMVVRMEASTDLVSPDFRIEKFKTQTTRVVEPVETITGSAALMDDYDAEADSDAVDADEAPPARDDAATEIAERSADGAPEAEDGGESPSKKRRRRRRRRKGRDGDNEGNGNGNGNDEANGDDATAEQDASPETDTPEGEEEAAPRKKRSRSRSRRRKSDDTQGDDTVSGAPQDTPEPQAEATPEPAQAASEPTPEPAPEPQAEPAAAVAPVRPEPAAPKAQDKPADKELEPANGNGGDGDAGKPKRRGWWSLGR
ncbi:ribonuclease E/G [Palleronia sediminis]|uniref:Ribonuclease E n=1 Tax=Palleronia sediminis TaxID=2547833 RepID=A0A4R6ALG4_9RHOB|nr:ribonuclease E/G [Palleronia sediminis]